MKHTAEETRAQSKISLTIALHCRDIGKIEEIESNNILCHAEGFLYVTKNVTVKFSADVAQLTVSSIGNMTSICEETEPIMPFVITEVQIYGLNDTMNNYDHMRQVDTTIDLCELSNESTLVIPYE